MRQYFGTAVLDGKIYVVGGDTGGSGDRDTLYLYDPALNTWTTLAPMPLGSRYELGAAAINGKIYAVGGVKVGSSTVLTRLEVYDPATNTWTTKTSMPTPHYAALVGAINGKLFVAGGGVDSAGTPTTALDVYDPATDSWSTKAPMPFTGNSDGGVVLGGKLFSMGGGPSPENRVFAYDAATNSWSTNFAPMPTGRHAIGIAADEINNKIFAVGGWLAGGGYAVALEVFTLQPSSSTGTHNAGGTYTWNATTGVTTLTWTSSDFTCEGPNLGTEPQTGVTVTATTMTWANDNMTWTRSSGTAGDILGTWTSTDSATGNSYMLTFNANGTVSVTGVIVQCGGGDGGSSAKAEAQHWSDSYHVQLRYSDPTRAASSISVTGPGITGSAALTYNTQMGSWGSGTPESQISFGTTYPAGLPFTYTFSVTDATGTWTATSMVSCFQQAFVANISPAGSVTGTPTFSWTGITDPSAIYGVQVNDSNGNWLWANYNVPGTSIAYNGPALTSGMTYGYVVSLQSSSACIDQTSGGGSYVAGNFTYQ